MPVSFMYVCIYVNMEEEGEITSGILEKIKKLNVFVSVLSERKGS